MTVVRFGATVELPVPVATAYDYLGDPRNRPEWQASLLSVTIPDRGEPYEGMAWRETTMVGVRPRLRITEMVPDRVWGEVGHWAGVTGRLRLLFADSPGGCRVYAKGSVSGRGVYAAAARAAGAMAGRVIALDLKRAGRILAEIDRPTD